MIVTKEQLHEIMPKATGADLEKYAGSLSRAMAKFAIFNKIRAAAFLANIAHESGELKYSTENLNYSAEGLLKIFGKYFTPSEAQSYAKQPERIASRVYADRMGNGTEETKDGWKYRGRGPIQITGKDNYIAAGRAINVDLLNHPELAEGAEVGSLCSAWFWQARGLNQLADIGNFNKIVMKINGGYNGLAERHAYWEIAKKVL